MASPTIEILREHELAAARQRWTELLQQSPQDPLFGSWDWNVLWWKYFGRPSGRELRILMVHRHGTLIGIAPFYRVTRRASRWINARSIQWVGASFRDSDTLISEYLDIIARPADRQCVVTACMANLLALDDWSELVLSWSDRQARLGEIVRQATMHERGYLREPDHALSYQADLSAGFDRYLQSIGASTRRALWGLRRRLEAHGRVRLLRADTAGVVADLDELNRLHALRWGQPVFSGPRLAFHQEFAARMAEQGRLVLTRLQVGERTVSVLYDVRIGTRQYNLQMGFDPDFERRTSLGLLHLGYAMEEAAAVGVGIYDFLAGPGKATDYKKSLSQCRRELATVQYVRGPLLSRLYRWHDRLVVMPSRPRTAASLPIVSEQAPDESPQQRP